MATTLFVRKVGGKGVKLLTLGGDPSRWAVGNGDGGGELATASLRLSRYALDIDVRGRRLTARMPTVMVGNPEVLEVVDDGTGER